MRHPSDSSRSLSQPSCRGSRRSEHSSRSRRCRDPQQRFDRRDQQAMDGRDPSGACASPATSKARISRIEHRAANGDYDRLPGLARELVNHPVGVIIAAGGPISAMKAKEVTKNSPDRLYDDRRPGQERTCGQSQPARRKSHRDRRTDHRTRRQTARTSRRAKPSKGKIGVLANVEAARRGCPIARTRSRGPATWSARSSSTRSAARRNSTQRSKHWPKRGSRTGRHCRSAVQLSTARQVVGLAARYRFPAIYQWREFVDGRGTDELRAKTSRMPIIRPAFTRAGFSRAHRPQICRSCSRPASIWSSTTRRRRRLASSFRTKLLAIADETIED